MLILLLIFALDCYHLLFEKTRKDIINNTPKKEEEEEELLQLLFFSLSLSLVVCYADVVISRMKIPEEARARTREGEE